MAAFFGGNRQGVKQLNEADLRLTEKKTMAYTPSSNTGVYACVELYQAKLTKERKGPRAANVYEAK